MSALLADEALHDSARLRKKMLFRIEFLVALPKHSMPMYQAANAMGSDDEDSLNETLRIKLSMKMKVLALVEEILHLETIEKQYIIIRTYI